MKNSVRVIFLPRANRQYQEGKPDELNRLTNRQVLQEIGEYIAAHEAAGVRFDTEAQEIVYCGGITMILRKEKDVWLIVEVVTAKSAVSYAPVYVWKQIRRGVLAVMARVFAHWRRVPIGSPAMA